MTQFLNMCGRLLSCNFPGRMTVGEISAPKTWGIMPWEGARRFVITAGRGEVWGCHMCTYTPEWRHLQSICSLMENRHASLGVVVVVGRGSEPPFCESAVRGVICNRRSRGSSPQQDVSNRTGSEKPEWRPKV